ncbi:hypothetical protein GQR60_18065 [Labilibaculum sp. A4]|uniref:hypothetical protein n=1 Tax=Labilibaculum euxinus TaxID=2686357 RepID=UPI000F619D2B|nr:hypothetical protein [Labilibaculum euxinus]MDQ1772470.1 hypothetical protein [Labilibaculum euxinus]MWN78245.1 hypothetical protein [Labilibaculum euxinus]
MYQKDFIMRMLEMIADLIALLLGLIKKGDLSQAHKLLENAYRDFLKEDASFFRNLPKEKLTEDLLTKHNYTNSHLKILSELFFAEAELNIAKGDKVNGLNYYEKSLLLLEFTEKDSNTFSLSNDSKIRSLKEKIKISMQ